MLSSREFCYPHSPGVQSPSLPQGSGVLGLREKVSTWGDRLGPLTGPGQPVNEELDGLQLISVLETEKEELAKVLGTGPGRGSTW